MALLEDLIKEGGFFKIEFKDNGIGIDKKYHNSIFDMFSRLHTESSYKRTGLGLALSKKIIDEMNGQIQIQSEFGQVLLLLLPSRYNA